MNTAQELFSYMVLDNYGDLKPLNHQYLPSFTSVGCYPVIYLTEHCEVLCADCATKALYQLDDEYDPPVTHDVFWEGSPEWCADCNKVIESAYGDPEETCKDYRDTTDNDDNENYRPTGMG